MKNKNGLDLLMYEDEKSYWKNGYELVEQLDALSDLELINGNKAYDIALDILDDCLSDGDGQDILIELLSNDFVYDYVDYKEKGYFDTYPEVANFAEQGLLILHVVDYISWASDMNALLERATLKGKQWKELPKNVQKTLVDNAWPVDGSSGNACADGYCIIDTLTGLSILGKIVDDEIIPDDNAILYDPRLKKSKNKGERK